MTMNITAISGASAAHAAPAVAADLVSRVKDPGQSAAMDAATISTVAQTQSPPAVSTFKTQGVLQQPGVAAVFAALESGMPATVTRSSFVSGVVQLVVTLSAPDSAPGLNISA